MADKNLLTFYFYALHVYAYSFTTHEFPYQTDHKGAKTMELLERTQRELRSTSSPTSTLKLIDTLQRLGIAYHFDEEINAALEGFMDYWHSGEDLFTTALHFRLLRHNGFQISSDVFQKFVDKNGKFNGSLKNDTWGMLSLYEASYLGGKDEDILSQATEFTETQLRQSIPLMEPQLGRQVSEAIQLPRHLRMVRFEARRFIEQFSRESDQSSALLELAKLDYDQVQSLHQSELAEISRWWKQLGIVHKLGFGRDRPLECFLWTVGILPEPKYSSCRIELAKTIAILLVLDDIFDSYGSLDELVLFTEAIRRWDLSAMEQLPEYMKICYMALYNTTNEIGYNILKEHGWSIVPFLKRTWIDMIEGFLLEAQWLNNGYVPKIEEYIENGVTTAGTYMALVHIFFLIGQGVTTETISMLDPYPKVFSCSGRILRLWDDLGTATEEQERGDISSSIELLIREKNLSSQGEGRKEVKQMIHSLWKELNGELMAAKALPLPIIKAAFNMSRTSQIVYQHGDDHRFPNVDDCVQSLFFTPVRF
ncbi:monoterpene synthase TPS4, chloroplastic-like [Cornus florida]|uniref:monoterpene synthase TPS4, chloroplastic-like n=1 Tax=Cornus florida TaxID=4283 RepID=UPI00289D7616|nr:monoterpene synthase TPS4, chloroplastic-like [Cornus florida]